MKGAGEKEGILSHSVKNKLFWSFVYVLLFVWVIIVLNQALLDELIDYMLLKTDLRIIHDETRIVSWQIETLRISSAISERSLGDLDVQSLKKEALERLKARKTSLDKLTSEYPAGKPPYRFIILKRRATAILAEIYILKEKWEKITGLLDQFYDEGGVIPSSDYYLLESTFDSMREILTVVDESDPGLRSSLVNASRQVIHYYNTGFLIFIVVLILVFVYLYRSFITPLEKLGGAFNEVKGGDLGLRVELRGGNEFTLLANAFNSMVTELEGNRDTLVNVNERLQALYEAREAELEEKKISLEMARDVQQAIIPMSFHWRNIKLATGFIPFEELSGDFLDLFPLGGKQIAFLFGDIMGKGIPASLRMMSFHALFRATIQERSNMAEVARVINRFEIGEDWHRNENLQLTTAILGRIDLGEMSFHMVNCGHPQPVMWRKSRQDVIELPVTNPLIGFDENVEFEEMTIDLMEGDMLFFYTDGLIEQQNPEGEEYDANRVKETVRRLSHLPPREFIDAFQKDLAQFSGAGESAHFHDDILFCILRVEAYPYREFSSPALDRDELTSAIIKYMREEEIPNDIISDVNLAFQELYANAFQHGNHEDPDRKIVVGICLDKGELSLYVEDEGEGFDHSSIDFLLNPEKIYGERGRGLYLVKGVVDDIEFNEAGNRVTIHKKLPPMAN